MLGATTQLDKGGYDLIPVNIWLIGTLGAVAAHKQADVLFFIIGRSKGW